MAISWMATVGRLLLIRPMSAAIDRRPQRELGAEEEQILVLHVLAQASASSRSAGWRGSTSTSRRNPRSRRRTARRRRSDGRRRRRSSGLRRTATARSSRPSAGRAGRPCRRRSSSSRRRRASPRGGRRRCRPRARRRFAAIRRAPCPCRAWSARSPARSTLRSSPRFTERKT